MARLCPDAFPGTRRWQNVRAVRPPASDGDKVLARCIPGRFAVARFRRGAFPGGNPWQFLRSMHPESGLGRENRQFAARLARHASEMSWLWQDMRAMHPKSPANRRWRIHRANILPGRGPFRRTGPRIMHSAQILPSAAEQRGRSPPLWAAERGAGGFLPGGVTLPKECVVLWGVERWRQSWHQ